MQIIIIDLCYDNKCIKITIGLILTVQINFDTTPKKRYPRTGDSLLENRHALTFFSQTWSMSVGFG